MSVMGFAVHPGPLPFRTVRDAEKWLPRLTNGQIEIRGEGCDMPQQMVKVTGMVYPVRPEYCAQEGLYVPDVYAGRRLMIVHLEALNG